MDDIKLPKLPVYFHGQNKIAEERTSVTRKQFEDYARAAVLADRTARCVPAQPVSSNENLNQRIGEYLTAELLDVAPNIDWTDGRYMSLLVAGIVARIPGGDTPAAVGDEPVAHLDIDGSHRSLRCDDDTALNALPDGAPLYARPQPTAPTDDDALWEQTLTERDHYHDMADRLAAYIAAITGVDIGEHSNANEPWRNAMLAADDYIAAQPREASPDDIRAQGWTVAVHNDYRQGGVPHTFWLFARDGAAVKGEGRTDAEALAQVRAAIASQEQGS